MALISFKDVRVAFGGAPLLDGVSFEIGKGERICLLGRNGCGKTTLLRTLAGELAPDAGEVVVEKGVRIAWLPQDIPDASGKVFDIVNPPGGDWRDEPKTRKILDLTGLDGDMDYDKLSGGMRRRVFLAKALAASPDVLLLDEPTNHLDIGSINWLEDFILSSRLAVVFVTHDRRLVRRLANRIAELDRGQFHDWECDYATFLARRQADLAAEEKEWARFDKKLAKEEVWIRQGIKARRTRDEGRVKDLKRMREERRGRRQRSGKVSMAIAEAGRSGERVIVAEGVSFAYGDSTIVSGFDFELSRGDRVGIVGANGCGKTTLLNLLLGKLPPTIGRVVHGANLKPVYFDQLRGSLDPERSLIENLVPTGGDRVEINGGTRHVFSYLQDFLFTSDRAKCPVKVLSGGERNRLLLARLFLLPANLLVFDEPTNDLDIETLELLEELLADFNGSVMVVSHDREFLDNFATCVLAHEGGGVFQEYVGGCAEWQAAVDERARQAAPESKPKADTARKSNKFEAAESGGAAKITYKEVRELADLPTRIEELEGERESLHDELLNPGSHGDGGAPAAANARRLAALEDELATAYIRWETLDAKQQSSGN